MEPEDVKSEHPSVMADAEKSTIPSATGDTNARYTSTIDLQFPSTPIISRSLHASTPTIMPNFDKIALSDFLPTNPSLWYSLAERQFRVHKITDAEIMTSIITSKLPGDVLERCSDILELSVEPSVTYNQIKERIISLYKISGEEKLDQLLRERDVSLGTRKPSVLLNDMRILAGKNTSEEILKRLWLRRLPQRMQEHVAIHKVPLDSLAAMADSLHAIMGSNTSSTYAISLTRENATSSTSRTPSIEELVEARFAELSQKIAALTSIKPEKNVEEKLNELSAQIAALSTQQNERSRGRFRDRSRSRTRTRAPTPTPRKNSPQRPELCWYHWRFGEAAEKCIQPCNYKAPVTETKTPSEN